MKNNKILKPNKKKFPFMILIFGQVFFSYKKKKSLFFCFLVLFKIKYFFSIIILKKSIVRVEIKINLKK
jgi:hypothetical protein